MRRHVIAASAAALLALALTASARQGKESARTDERRLTAPAAGSTAIICHPEEPGCRMLIAGRVCDAAGRPIPGATVLAYNTDIDGLYVPRGTTTRTPRIRGSVVTDDDGRFQFLTVRPGSYPGEREPAHIHFHATAAGYLNGYSTIWFEGDPFITAGKESQMRRYMERNPDDVTRIEAVEQLEGGLQAVRHTIRLSDG